MRVGWLVAVGIAACVSSVAVAQTADEIAAELANPATPMSSLGNHLEYRTFDGDLPGATDQEALIYTFQPSMPFPQGDGSQIIALRPAIPIIIDQPLYGESGFTDEGPELGDIAFDFVYGGTSKKGAIRMVGLFGVLPTATDDALGADQWRLGPEVFLGKIRPWGVVGALIFHQWDVGGDNDEATSLTSLNYVYSFNLGGGYQLASGPTITYDWEADSDQAWTVPLGVGLAKTVIAGKTPLKMQAQVFYNVEAPDAFAQEWGVKLSLTPVVKNPFVGD